jgi:hypothetical protein
MEEQKGGHLMNEWWNSQSEEWWRDMDRLDDKLVDVLDFYDEFQDKHGGIPGWDIIESALFFVIPGVGYRQETIPEDEW